MGAGHQEGMKMTVCTKDRLAHASLIGALLGVVIPLVIGCGARGEHHGLSDDYDDKEGTIAHPVPAPGTTYVHEDGSLEIYGTDDDDEIHGTNDGDQIYLGAGDDRCDGWGGDDWIRGDEGNDQIKGDEGDDNIHGGDDDDIIWGQRGNDDLNGGKGDDWVMGGPGDDLIVGGPGDDKLNGGRGKDRFFFNPKVKGHDMIFDFVPGEDRIIIFVEKDHPIMGSLPVEYDPSGHPVLTFPGKSDWSITIRDVKSEDLHKLSIVLRKR